MKGRTLWFLVGTGAGIVTTIKARRLAYRLTPSGVSDQAGAVGVGLQAFADEVRTGMATREAELAAELGMPAMLNQHSENQPAQPRQHPRLGQNNQSRQEQDSRLGQNNQSRQEQHSRLGQRGTT